MRYLVVISLTTLFTTACCKFIKYDPSFPALSIELRDMDTGEDLFISGQLSIDSIKITNIEFPDQHFSIQEQMDRTIIYFGPSQEDYTISVGNNLSFDLMAWRASEEKKCYTSTTITGVSVTPYVFEANGDEYLKDWTVIVWVN